MSKRMQAGVTLPSGATVSISTAENGQEVVSIDLPDRSIWIAMTPLLGVRVTSQAGTLVLPGEEEEVAYIPWGRG